MRPELPQLPFNSRPHAEVDREPFATPPLPNAFNSRPHAEVDEIRCPLLFLDQCFQLTTSRRGRPSVRSICAFPQVFQLTTSRRGRLAENGKDLKKLPFNSRPHAEVDPDGLCYGSWQVLSTHDLTQRSTSAWKYIYNNLFLSTHDLTQRSTTPINNIVSYYAFNSRPHAEVDASDRRQRTVKRDLSTHDLTQRSTVLPLRTEWRNE